MAKQRVLDPAQPISGEQNCGRGSARVGCCRLDHGHCVTDFTILRTDGVAQGITQHGEQVLHLELELKG